MEILSLILPIFAIIVTGYLFVQFKILPESMADVLIEFAFYVAVPALLFMVIAQESVERLLNFGFIAAYGGGLLIVFVAVLAAANYWLYRSMGESTMFAMISTQSNTGFVALPVLHGTLGEPSVLPVAIANVIIVAMFLVNLVMIELFRPKGPEGGRSLLATIGHALLNPLILSTILGVAYALSGLKLPGLATDYLKLLAGALTPCALFAVGMTIRLEHLRISATTILVASIIKLIALPVLVLILALLLGLNPIFTIAATICAAVPTAKNAYLLAAEYDQSKQLVADTISVTTVVSILTLIVWLFVFGQIYPEAFQTH